MTTPEPADRPETAAGEPDDATAPMRLGLVFWLLIAFGVLCVVSGAAVAAFGPVLFPKHPAQAQSAAPGPGATRMALGAPRPPR